MYLQGILIPLSHVDHNLQHARLRGYILTVLSHVQESMETKTDMEPDIHLTVQPTMTVSEVQKEVEKRMGWLPTNQLKRCMTFVNTWVAIHSLGP